MDVPSDLLVVAALHERVLDTPVLVRVDREAPPVDPLGHGASRDRRIE